MEKIILFNEEEFHQFPTPRDAAKFLDVTQDKITFCGKVNKNSQIQGYYVEFEEDKIVQYHFRTPVKVWYSIKEIADVLLVHEELIKKSLQKTNQCIERLHFKYFSQTHARPL